jgi:hypothetical protein
MILRGRLRNSKPDSWIKFLIIEAFPRIEILGKAAIGRYFPSKVPPATSYGNEAPEESPDCPIFPFRVKQNRWSFPYIGYEKVTVT